MNHRDKVQDMKPLEAVDYLLHVIDQIQPKIDDDHAVDELGLPFTPKERLTLISLFEANGRVLSKYQITDATHAGCEDEPELKTVDVRVCNIRRKLKGTGWNIVTAWGRGYRLEVAQ